MGFTNATMLTKVRTCFIDNGQITKFEYKCAPSKQNEAIDITKIGHQTNKYIYNS